jgi:hypothetical protein
MVFTIPNIEASITVALPMARATPSLFVSHHHRKAIF